jgi:hypothetical protein
LPLTAPFGLDFIAQIGAWSSITKVSVWTTIEVVVISAAPNVVITSVSKKLVIARIATRHLITKYPIISASIDVIIAILAKQVVIARTPADKVFFTLCPYCIVACQSRNNILTRSPNYFVRARRTNDCGSTP